MKEVNEVVEVSVLGREERRRRRRKTKRGREEEMKGEKGEV